MRVLILGVTGFIGRHVAAELLRHGHRVTGVSRSGLSADQFPPAAELKYVKGSVEDAAGLATLAKQHDAIIYCTPWNAEADPVCVDAILTAIAGLDKWFVYTSGTAVVAKLSKGEFVDEIFAEDTPFTPSPALAARAELERTILAASHGANPARTLIIRPPIVMGHGSSGQVGLFHAIGERFGKVFYIGSGSARWSFVHVDDLARLYRLALERGTAGSVYHAVAGEVDWRTIAEAMAEADGREAASWPIEDADAALGKSMSRIVNSSNSRTDSQWTESTLEWSPSPERQDILSDIRAGLYRNFPMPGPIAKGE